jgi:hypothetical protein
MDRKVSATGWFPVSNSQIQITKPGPPPVGGGLRRTNREPTRRVGVRRTNLKVSGVGFQVSGNKSKQAETFIFSSTLQAFFELADHKSTQIGKICLS